MNNFEFNEKELIGIINNLVPSYQKKLVLSAMEEQSDEGFNQIGLVLVGESEVFSQFKKTGVTKSDSKSMFTQIKIEIYDYMCTNSKKYKKERTRAGITIEQIITIIATAIAGAFNIAAGVIIGAVVVGLISFLNSPCGLFQRNSLTALCLCRTAVLIRTLRQIKKPRGLAWLL